MSESERQQMSCGNYSIPRTEAPGKSCSHPSYHQNGAWDIKLERIGEIRLTIKDVSDLPRQVTVTLEKMMKYFD